MDYNLFRENREYVHKSQYSAKVVTYSKNLRMTCFNTMYHMFILNFFELQKMA